MRKEVVALLLAAMTAFVFAGTLKDKRDGKVYKTVKIGGLTWMAQNLNYAVDNGYGSWCYDNDYRHCKKYGRLYTYYAAMNACPDGWHLPSEYEWGNLFKSVGGMQNANYVLRSKDDWYYNDGDRFKFKVLPAGYYNRMDGHMYMDGRTRWEFGYLGQWAIFRTSSNGVTYYFPGPYTNVVRDDTADRNGGFSVRCVKDY